MNKHDLGKIVLNFFKDFLIQNKGVSQNTMASYSDCIALLLNFTAETLKKKVVEIELEDINEDVILAFLDYLEKDRANKTRTRNQRLAVIKTFFEFVASKIPEMLEISKKIHSISMKKTEKKIVESLTEDETKAFFKALQADEKQYLRDLALFRILYNTGARVSEIINIKIEDIDMENSFHVKLHGKGNKERIVMLFQETVEALRDYIEWREEHNCHNEFLFINKYEEKMTRQGVNYLVDKYFRKASETTPSLKGKKISPHSFRHTTALHLLKSGNDITLVKDWLGHEDINTTAEYVKIDIQMKRNAIEKINIFKNRKKNPKEKWKMPEVLRLLKNISEMKPVLC